MNQYARASFSAMLLLIGAAQARATDSYDPATMVLTMPTLAIGSASYSNVQVTVGRLVTPPSGSSASGSVDRYDPVSGRLTVQSVTLNNQTYYNVVVTVQSLGSIGSVSGADSYSGGDLAVSTVGVANAYYVDVVLAASAGNIVGVGGGMPLEAVDVFSPSTGLLSVPAIQAFGHVYTNVTLKVGLTDVVSVGGTAGRFVYVSNGGSGTISAYAINRQTGALTPLSAGTVPVSGSSTLWEIHVDPSGKYLYVLDAAAAGIYGFSINQADGSLTALNGGAPFAAGSGPQSLVFDATGVYAYAANAGDGTIWAYSLDASTGALSELGSPYSISGSAENVSPDQMVRAGNHLYVADSIPNSVEVFTISPGTGALTRGVAGSPFATDVGLYGLAVDPSGSVLYTANAGSLGGGSISAFTVNSSTGVLTPVAGNPLAIPVSEFVSIDPEGRFLFVTETNDLGVYPIDLSTGVLGSPVAGSPFTTGTSPNIAIADPTDHFVYVGNDGSANVSEFTFTSATGLLSPAAPSPAAAGTYPDFIAVR
jgi:6-phosphogluconolactonase (cycloisomerase 2 family)